MINIYNPSCFNGCFAGSKVGATLLSISSLSAFLLSRKASLPENPNIVFILIDDLGYGNLSNQGGKDILQK